MDLLKEGSSTGCPPLLDGTNYGYWKARMCAFNKSIDEKAWKKVLTGWTSPTVTDEEGNVTVKSELIGLQKKTDWKALNTIFHDVNPTQFKSISTAESAKEAWDTLQIKFEGTSTVRESRL